jgi:hypothetical protein
MLLLSTPAHILADSHPSLGPFTGPARFVIYSHIRVVSPHPRRRLIYFQHRPPPPLFSLASLFLIFTFAFADSVSQYLLLYYEPQ